MKKILIIDDEASVCTLLTGFLGRHKYATESCTSGAAAVNLLRKQPFDLILCDYRLGDTLGSELLEKIRILQPDAIVIFITGYVELQVAVDLVKSGAYNYVSKPLYPDELLKMIQSAFSDLTREKLTKNLIKDAGATARHIDSDQYVTGESVQAKELQNNVSIVAPTNYNVIIYGETGTGKEALARLVHENSGYKDGAFIAIDCGCLSKELAISALFGHEKGAFTGALNSQPGAFELADKGTLFLDEIGNLNYEVQTYLLRALQEKEIRRLGGIKQIPVDTRIIVASNENLSGAIKNGKFREDLYYRLNEFEITVPPLRERKADINVFIDHFLKRSALELEKSITGINEQARTLLENYEWPGNIRELKNVIRRACLLTSDGHPIREKLLSREILNGHLNTWPLTPALSQDDEDITNPEYDLKSVASRAEYHKIQEVLKKVKYNKTKAATILNIDRKTLYNKLKVIE
jgi:two-component system response regulator HydG